jgi:Ca2+-binding EF-hand superfamily protein
MRSHGMGMRMHGRMFESADANHDGKVSLAEMTNAAVHHFDEADANHDGTLTPEERMQMHQRMKAEHAKPA